MLSLASSGSPLFRPTLIRRSGKTVQSERTIQFSRTEGASLCSDLLRSTGRRTLVALALFVKLFLLRRLFFFVPLGRRSDAEAGRRGREGSSLHVGASLAAGPTRWRATQGTSTLVIRFFSVKPFISFFSEGLGSLREVEKRIRNGCPQSAHRGGAANHVRALRENDRGRRSKGASECSRLSTGSPLKAVECPVDSG